MARSPALSLALLAVGLAAASGCSGRRADYMPLAVGNRWDYRVVRSDGGSSRHSMVITGKVSELVYEADDGGQRCLWSKEDGWVARQAGGLVAYLLYLPPAAGVKWQNVVAGRKLKIWCRIAGRETVSVPAGTFPGCPVVVMEPAGGKTERRYWFAPDVGWVRYSYGPRGGRPWLVRELVDYQLEKPGAGG